MKPVETRKKIYAYFEKKVGREITAEEHDEIKKLLVEMAKAENEINQVTIRDLLNRCKNNEERILRLEEKKKMKK